MDKNITKTHSPGANLDYFLSDLFLLDLFGPIVVPRRSTKSKDIRGQEKDEKDQKMVSHLFIDLFVLRLCLLFT